MSKQSPKPVPKPVTFAFMRRHLAYYFALGFGSGLSPIAPGTVGTLWAWLTFDYLLLLNPVLLQTYMGWVVLAALGLGVWSCKKTAQDLNRPDPSAIVWDEIVAFWGLLWVLEVWVSDSNTLAWQAAAFVLFRLFDAVKWGPVAWADRHFKGFGWRGAFGIMLDDLIAAVMALLPLLLWRYFMV